MVTRAEHTGSKQQNSGRSAVSVALLGALGLLQAGAIVHAGINQPEPGAPVPAAAVADIPREYQIKAALLFNFTKLVEWPRESFAAATDPIVIAVLGDSPCFSALDIALKGRTVNGRAIVVRRVESAQEAAAAQVLFVSASYEDRFAAIATRLESAPVLTVGESAAFAAMRGSAINFIVRQDKVGFEIHLNAAVHARLKLSTHLLQLATDVRWIG